jgi:Fic family protein
MVLRKPDTSAGFRPKLLIDDSMRSPATRALRMDGQLDKGILSTRLHELVLTSARVRNVVSSLLMEGAHVDFSRARTVVETGKPTTDNEAQLLRFAKRYRWIHDTPAEKLPEPDAELALKLHAELYKGQDSFAPGEFKAEENGIVDSVGIERFRCTPPARLQKELAALQAWLEAERGAQLEAAVAATWFAEFEAIHPFVDGNGRLGRLLNLLLLKKLGYDNAALVPLDARFYKSGDRYYEKLAATNTGTNWHVWARYYCHELQRAYEQSVRMGDLRPLLESQTSKPTRAVLGWVLAGGPEWFRRADFPNTDGFSDVAITKALASLHDQGVLDAEGEKRGRKYRLATGFLEKAFRGLLP